MRAIGYQEFGDADQLKLVTLDAPALGDDEVLIKTTYAGVNPVDWKIRKGYLKDMFPHHFPIVPGWDTVGVVDAVGKNVENLEPGNRVYAYARKPDVQWGTYAEYVSFEAQHVALAPDKLSDAEASGVPLVGLTAWQSLFDFADLQTGQSILIHAGAGGVGSLAIQLAKWKGAEVFTTGSADNHEYLKSIGADVVIDYRKNDFVSMLKDLRPNGVDVVYDLVGGDVQDKSFGVVKEGGTLVSIVGAPSDDLRQQNHLGKVGFVFVEPNGAQLAELARLFDQDVLKASPVKEYSLVEAAKAHQESESGRVRGKLVLRIR